MKRARSLDHAYQRFCSAHSSRFVLCSIIANSCCLLHSHMSGRLEDAQLDSFVKDGFLHLGQVLAPSELCEAIRLINNSLGKPGALHPGGIQDGMGKLGGGLSNHRVMRALYHDTAVKSVIGELLGAGNCDDANLAAQIALRFPEDCLSPDESPPTPMWHTDGLRQGKLHPFSLLVGICLSDVQSLRSGNLVVYPGAHTLVAACIAGPHGRIDAARLQRHLDGASSPDADADADAVTDAADAAADTAKEVHTAAAADAQHDNEPVLPAPGVPHSFLTRAGDVLLLHPDLPHFGDHNLHHEIRSIVYFRLKVRVAPGDSWQALSLRHRQCIWSDFGQAVQRAAVRAAPLASLPLLSAPPPAPGPTLATDESTLELRDRQQQSRLLYANPVCLLGVSLGSGRGASSRGDNLMVISWLTCVDNKGTVFLSMNEKRHSAAVFDRPCASSGDYIRPVLFTLSVPTSGMQDTLVAVGRVHGCDVDKFGSIAGLTRCAPGWAEDGDDEEKESAVERVFAVRECAAHLVLSVSRPPDCSGGHFRIFAQITRAHVKKAYWDGKNFAPRDASRPPLLAFNGSSCFSKMCPL